MIFVGSVIYALKIQKIYVINEPSDQFEFEFSNLADAAVKG